MRGFWPCLARAFWVLQELGAFPERPSPAFLAELERRVKLAAETLDMEKGRALAEGRPAPAIDEIVAGLALGFPTEEQMRLSSLELQDRFEMVAGRTLEAAPRPPSGREMTPEEMKADEDTRILQAAFVRAAEEHRQGKLRGEAPDFEAIASRHLARARAEQAVSARRFGGVPIGPEFTAGRGIRGGATSFQATGQRLPEGFALEPGLPLQAFAGDIGATAAAALSDLQRREVMAARAFLEFYGQEDEAAQASFRELLGIAPDADLSEQVVLAAMQRQQSQVAQVPPANRGRTLLEMFRPPAGADTGQVTPERIARAAQIEGGPTVAVVQPLPVAPPAPPLVAEVPLEEEEEETEEERERRGF